MRGVLTRAAGLLAIYLLVLTSVAPGDVLVGGLLALAVATWLRPAPAPGRAVPSAPGEGLTTRLRAAAATAVETLGQMAVGSARVVRFCLGAPARPGLVEIPRGQRSRFSVALWGVLTGEAPDETVVEADAANDVLIVHTVDGTTPDDVRERHARTHARRQRKVVP
jgi:multisubunit Na+/H+ antiporter MnhE subunit